MRNRYDGSSSKEATIANVRQRRYEAEHSARNSFVKREQAAQSRYAGRQPDMKGDLMELDAEMQNTGAWAQDFGRKLTKGLDKVAFPVDGEGNDS